MSATVLRHLIRLNKRATSFGVLRVAAWLYLIGWTVHSITVLRGAPGPSARIIGWALALAAAWEVALRSAAYFVDTSRCLPWDYAVDVWMRLTRTTAETRYFSALRRADTLWNGLETISDPDTRLGMLREMADLEYVMAAAHRHPTWRQRNCCPVDEYRARGWLLDLVVSAEVAAIDGTPRLPFSALTDQEEAALIAAGPVLDRIVATPDAGERRRMLGDLYGALRPVFGDDLADTVLVPAPRKMWVSAGADV